MGAGKTLPIKSCDDKASRKDQIDCLAPNRRVTIEVTGTAFDVGWSTSGERLAIPWMTSQLRSRLRPSFIGCSLPPQQARQREHAAEHRGPHTGPHRRT